MAQLRGRIWDRASGRPLAARVHVLASTGQFRAPEDALERRGHVLHVLAIGFGRGELGLVEDAQEARVVAKIIEEGAKARALALGFGAGGLGAVLDVARHLEPERRQEAVEQRLAAGVVVVERPLRDAGKGAKVHYFSEKNMFSGAHGLTDTYLNHRVPFDQAREGRF